MYTLVFTLKCSSSLMLSIFSSPGCEESLFSVSSVRLLCSFGDGACGAALGPSVSLDTGAAKVNMLLGNVG